jgi:hypothetical protein
MGNTFSNLLSKVGSFGRNFISPKLLSPTTPEFEAEMLSGAHHMPQVTQRPSPQVSAPPAQAQETIPSSVQQPSTRRPLSMDDMVKMINIYGGEKAPLHQYSNQLAKATQDYDFWGDNPELLALIPHLETSSGRDVTRPNNLTNWGINYPGNNEIFETMDKSSVLDRFLSGMAVRDPNYPQFRTGQPLSDEELFQLAKIYEPKNDDYGPSLVNGRRHVRQQMGW